MKHKRTIIIGGGILLLLLGIGAWMWINNGQESTDDAEVAAHVTPIAARVGGRVLRVPVRDNKHVEAGTVLVEIDPRDYELAIDKARAELANAKADAVAATASVPITSTTTTGNVRTARGTVTQAQASVSEAEHGVDVAKARLTAAQARVREQQANATKAAKDVDRLKGLLAKDEIAQQQFDAATAAAEASRAAVDTAVSQVREAELGIKVAESRLTQAQAGQSQAAADLATARTGPDQVAAMRARAAAAEAKVKQLQASLEQAQLNLAYATVKAPITGIVSKKSVEPGQVVQPGQPLMAIIPLDEVWIIANFKETQIEHMRPGQPVTIDVDAYGGHEFKGHIDSIAAATGATFSLLPPENATGNFVKVVQRVPVKIVLERGQDPDHLLRPGMSVTPTVHTK